jgi:hypothetical protein
VVSLGQKAKVERPKAKYYRAEDKEFFPMSRSCSVTSVELSMSRPERGAMNTRPIRRTVVAIGMTCLLSGSLLLTAVTPASARPDPGPPLPSAPGRIVERRVEVPVPIDDNAVEPAQVALGALGGAALAGAAVLVAGNTRRTRRLA